jgi:serine/threonine protein kinase
VPQLARQLTWERLLGIALDAARGMLYLHTRQPPIAHRDLKSANLLVNADWQVKVADFNLSRSIDVNTTASTVVMTNPRWLAPEVVAGAPGQLPAGEACGADAH